MACWGAPRDKVCAWVRHVSPVFHLRRMDLTPEQTTDTRRKFTDLRNLTHMSWGHIPDAEKNVSGLRSTQCRGGCRESKHVAVNRLMSSSVTSSAACSGNKSTDSSDASDAAEDKSPRECRGRERCSAWRSASPFNNELIPETPRIFDDSGRNRLPVVDGADATRVIGHATHVRALRFFNAELINNQVEEHR